jgi:hypothetical protein
MTALRESPLALQMVLLRPRRGAYGVESGIPSSRVTGCGHSGVAIFAWQRIGAAPSSWLRLTGSRRRSRGAMRWRRGYLRAVRSSAGFI